MSSKIALSSARWIYLYRKVEETMGKTRKNFYAVQSGRNTGVYSTWEECQAQVSGYSGAVFKGFSSRSEADDFADSGSRTRGHGGHYPGHSSSSSSARQRYSEHSSSSARQRYSGDFACSSRFSGSRSRKYCKDSSSSSSSSGYSPVVYTDGSCFRNGYRGARGGIGVYWGEGHPSNLSEKLDGHQTNQRAEVVSACRALESAIEQGHRSVELRTDSTYTIKSMTEWVPKWKRNGWQTSTSQDVKNKEDIQRLDNLCQRVDVKWTHVPGHKGIPGNEAADHLARAGSHKEV